MLWTIGIGGKEWKIDVGGSGAAELLLGFFGFVFDALHSGGVVSDVDAGIFFEFIDEEVDDDVVKVFTAEMCVAVCGHYFEDAIAELKDANIKSATTEVENDDFFVFFGLEAISQGCGGRFVNDTLDF